MTRRRTIVVTIGLMFSLFLASMEATVVATAMPTIVGQLGGLETYSWVFSAYMLASTTMVPLFGKLSDIFGRRPVYLSAMALFLFGSLLCGLATSMNQLIAFRAVQGIGAGGLLPLVFTIIGDMFSLEQRARMQGLFSGVWGVSAVVGPLLGGFLVDQVDWRWVFWINVVPGLLATALVGLAWIDRARAQGVARPSIDWRGAGLLTASVLLLLLGLLDLGAPTSWGLFAGAALGTAALVLVERRASNPIVPVALFRNRVFAVACLHGLLAGCAMFGSTAFVPLFAQAVLGTSATGAGAVLMPMLLGWVSASIVGSRLLLRVPFRTMGLLGTGLLAVGTFLLTSIDVGASRIGIGFDLALMGIGMGLSIPAFLIAVQSTVQRHNLGAATSTVQFSRNIGGTVGVSVMGAVLSMSLINALTAAGLDLSLAQQLLDSGVEGATAVPIDGAVRSALAGAIRGVFVVAFVAAALGVAATLLTPRGRIGQLPAGEGDEPQPRPASPPAAQGGR